VSGALSFDDLKPLDPSAACGKADFSLRFVDQVSVAKLFVGATGS
jgi:hypothetical protein